MRKPRPKLELSFRSFRLVAEELEAIQAIRWPLRILIVAVAVCIVIVACRLHPTSLLATALSYLSPER
jgi:hypothetical protein